MGKKSKKRRRKKLSSSSSDDDEKSSKDQDVTRKHKRAKRNQDVTSQKSGADKRDNSASPTIKDVFQSTRHIKKPIYRLSKTQATDQKPAKKEEKCTKAGSVTVPFHEGDCSSKTKHDISGKYYSASRSKSVERGSSKPSNTNSAITVPQRTEKTSKGSSDKKSSQRSPSKLKTQLMSPGIVSAEQKERAPDVLKRKGRAEETPRTGKDSNSVKTREQSKTLSVSKESARQKRIELVKERHKRHPEINPKTPCSDAKSFSAYPRTQSSPSAKHTTSVSSSDVVKKIISTSEKVKSVSHEAAKPSSAEQQTCSTPLPLKFKIPKIVQPRPVDSTSQNYNAKSTNVNLKWGNELSNSKKETVQQAHSCLDATPSVSSEEQDKRSSLSGQQLPATFVTLTEQWQDEMQVVEELHLARSERRLELDVLQSYGELTCMEIDLPEEGAPDTHCKQPPQQDLILVLDTNILLSHLDYVKKISSHGLGAMGFPVVLIPWVVLQEMDSLKKGRGLSGSVAHLAIPAISYIYSSLKSREPHLWGQSMQQAAESSNGLNAENNDDRVLQCCLQYQSLYPECALILCTNDKNLCSKALLSGVKAFSKNDLEAEAGGSTHCFRPLQNIKPLISPQVTSPMLSTKHTSAQPHSQERTGLSAGLAEKDNKRLSKKEDEDKTKWDLIRCVSELEDCLRDVLSNVLQVEMKAAYEELWLEIIYLKPPWSLLDILHCLKKHWIAVFGHIVPRRKQQTVTNLIDFFNSGDTADRAKILAALQDAKELVDAFWKSSSRAAGAYSILNNIENKLQSESESPACDVIMNDDNEDTQPTSSQVSHQEVWALFENIWSNVYQISLEVFKALGFDPHTMQSAQPVGGSPPPQDAVVCLHKLSSMVSQLLQAFSSVLSSAPGLEEVQMLLSIILTNKIVDVDSRLTAKDLLDCFSQEDYREKLRVGGNQLMELKGALDRCIGITGQHNTFPT